MKPEFYEKLIRTAPFGYAYHEIVLNSDGSPVDFIFLDVNSAFEELTGLKSADIINRRVTEVLPGIDNDAFNWINFYGMIAVEGGEKEFEQYSSHIDRWYRVRALSSEKNYFATIVIDITEEKIQREQLENFFSVNLDLLCIADTDGNFIKVNREWENTLGFSIDELQGSKFLDFVHPEDLDATLQAIGTLSSQKKVLNFVNRYRCKDGSYRHIEWRSHPEGNLIYAAARDITERIETEQKISESSLYNKALLEAIPDLMFILNYSGDILDYKPGDEDDLKMAPEVFLNKNISEVTPPYLSEQIKSGIETVIRKESHPPIEYPMDVKRGTGFFECSLYPFGRNKVIAMIKNITERKNSEEKLREAIREAETLRDNAEIANRGKSEFLANMGHEIRTPMNAIMGISKLLRDRHPGNLNPKQIEGLNLIYNGGVRLLALMDDLLDLSRIEAGKTTVEFTEFSLHEFAEEILKLTGALVADKRIQLKNSVNSSQKIIRTDHGKLRQILLNLTGNAVKFTDSGEISITYNSDSDKLSVSVADTGIGIAAEDIGRVFDAFTQLDSSAAKKYKGTGLGLTLAEKHVDLLGGSIEIESVPGSGTVISFTIPLVSPSAQHREKNQRVKLYTSEPGSHRSTLLVVDDDESTRETMRMILEDEYKVITAADGESALSVISEISPDLVLLDLMMPGMNGFEILKVIRSNSAASTIPVIAVTARVMPGDIAEINAAGFNSFVSKPLYYEVLRSQIEIALK